MSTTVPTRSTSLSAESGTFDRARWQKVSITTTAKDEFSFNAPIDDGDGHDTLKHDLAKSGVLSGLSTIQHMSMSLPETITEKEEAAEFAGIKDLEESRVSTTFKLPPHVQDDIIVNNGLEEAEKYSLLGGETDHSMEGTYLNLPTMPHSISNPSLLSIRSESDSHIISFTNPMFVEEDEEAQF